MHDLEQWALVLAVYFAPLIIALVRRQHNVIAVALLNLLLGWTLIGWFVALVGAFAKQRVEAETTQN